MGVGHPSSPGVGRGGHPPSPHENTAKPPHARPFSPQHSTKHVPLVSRSRPSCPSRPSAQPSPAHAIAAPLPVNAFYITHPARRLKRALVQTLFSLPSAPDARTHRTPPPICPNHFPNRPAPLSAWLPPIYKLFSFHPFFLHPQPPLPPYPPTRPHQHTHPMSLHPLFYISSLPPPSPCIYPSLPPPTPPPPPPLSIPPSHQNIPSLTPYPCTSPAPPSSP